jgi:hypothetical protein
MERLSDLLNITLLVSGGVNIKYFVSQLPGKVFSLLLHTDIHLQLSY